MRSPASVAPARRINGSKSTELWAIDPLIAAPARRFVATVLPSRRIVTGASSARLTRADPRPAADRRSLTPTAANRVPAPTVVAIVTATMAGRTRDQGNLRRCLAAGDPPGPRDARSLIEPDPIAARQRNNLVTLVA